MKKSQVKSRISFLLILVGAIFLIIEIASPHKNYYTQSIGVICLMTGVFLVNTNVRHKSNETTIEQSNYNEEE